MIAHRRDRKRTGRTLRAGGMAFWVLWVFVTAASVYLWWRGGMFGFGELPTHGLRTVLAFAVTAAFARIVSAALLRGRRKG